MNKLMCKAFERMNNWVGETAQWLRVLVALPEAQGSAFRTHIGAYNHL